MALDGVLLGAKDSDTAPFGCVLEFRYTFLKGFADAPQIVPNVAVVVVELKPSRAAAELIAHECVPDAAFLHTPIELVAVELWRILRNRLRPSVGYRLDAVGLEIF